MGDGVWFNGIEIEYCEEENILYWAVLRIRDVYLGSCFFTHPGFWILDLKTSTKERGEKNLL
jgi:hypothetical protein